MTNKLIRGGEKVKKYSKPILGIECFKPREELTTLTDWLEENQTAQSSITTYYMNS